MAKGGLLLEQLQETFGCSGSRKRNWKTCCYNIVREHCRTRPRKPTGHKHKWQLLLLSSSAFARQGDHNTSHKGKWAPRVGYWAGLTRVTATQGFAEGQCSEVASGQRFGWAQHENHVRGTIFTLQSRKDLSDHLACAWIFLRVSSCFPVGVLPLHVSHPPGRAVQNKGSAPVATTTLPAAFQAIFHPLAQQYYALNEHKSFSLLIFNETQTDPLHWTMTHPGTRGRKQAPSTT